MNKSKKLVYQNFIIGSGAPPIIKWKESKTIEKFSLKQIRLLSKVRIVSVSILIKSKDFEGGESVVTIMNMEDCLISNESKYHRIIIYFIYKNIPFIVLIQLHQLFILIIICNSQLIIIWLKRQRIVFV